MFKVETRHKLTKKRIYERTNSSNKRIMKTEFNEKLNIRKKANLFELEIENLSLMKEHCGDCLDSYSIYLNRRSAKLLCKKLQNLIKIDPSKKLIESKL